MDSFSRRDLLAGFAGSAVALTTSPSRSAAQPDVAAAATNPSDTPRFGSAQAALEAFVRVMGNMAGEPAPWWYTGHIYGVMPGQEPLPLVHFEGSETNLYRRQPDDSFESVSRTTTFYQSLDSHAILQQFDNPYTGRTLPVRPNVLGRGVSTSWSVDGVKPRWPGFPDAAPVPLTVSWVTLGEHAWMRHDRVLPRGLPQPIFEASTAVVRRADLENTELSACPAHFSSTYIARWPAWMDMAESSGHVVWHADGIKLPELASLPSGYLQRVRDLFPEQLDFS